MPNIAQDTLFRAVREDDEEILGGVLTLDDIDVDARNADNETALMLAARLGSARIAKKLLSRDQIGLKNADTKLVLNTEVAPFFDKVYEDDEGRRCWRPMPKTAAIIAEREGFISLNKAILASAELRPVDWDAVIRDCDDRKAELARCLARP